jgi:hypothetical protein
VFWFSVQMSYGYNQNFLFTNLIDNSIREPLQEIPSCVFTQGLPGLREIANAFHCGADFGAQLLSQTRALNIVVAGGVPQIIAGRLEEFDRHS